MCLVRVTYILFIKLKKKKKLNEMNPLAAHAIVENYISIK